MIAQVKAVVRAVKSRWNDAEEPISNTEDNYEEK